MVHEVLVSGIKDSVQLEPKDNTIVNAHIYKKTKHSIA